ncbi:CDP-alcohol phosphatidyltransferase family protein [Kitasatospora sp. NPDC089797]|uniref:CDP-alcohol phosphatidyltransferase family protein n=1 Tax=Kitasatospora sp. NPDC089797 TaxID=3155298 RepID=UPI00343DA476
MIDSHVRKDEFGRGSSAHRILTIPNCLSALRLAGVPVFFWLAVLPWLGHGNQDLWAVLVLILSGITDYLDGFLARKLDQVSELGRILDPVADRLYTVATLVALALRDLVPVWFLVALLARDAAMAVGVGLVRRSGFEPLRVSFVGKSATFCLMVGFPLVLLGSTAFPGAGACHALGWGAVIWGSALYLLATVFYFRQIVGLRREAGR